MGSKEMENVKAETVREEKEDQGKEMGLQENSLSNQNKMKKKMKKKQQRKKKRYYFIPKFGCMRSDDGDPTEEKPDVDGGFNVEAGCNSRHHSPNHLVVTVNGIIGSAQNWRFAAKQFVKAYPNDVIVHCSESNSSMLTFDGVDVMGKRLADEVISVVDRHPNLQKISFVGHSLGGLVARYAIAVLYRQDLKRKSGEENGECVEDESQKSSLEEKPGGRIAGLEPVNFITSATPHLGSRGHKQVPVFCGFNTMEKVASRASWLLGRTGKHLFLSDCDDGKPPLLLRMSIDTEDLKFISALQSFKRRVAYANARFDHLVGWSSSSLRRRSELPKRRSLRKNAKYPHICNEERSDRANPQEEVSLETKVVRGRASDMEETMIRGLTKLSWERVDVNFSGSIQRLLAHNTIQVKTRCINSAGADVIQHMVDNFEL
ncbi:putative alpha/beta hydrolase [Handroanthus impetiginosus]|uniref:Putative alpha/beta hydrolase n=1 Tax=Handroanthus impetiginosus TaxID=429701 RepID=A0A2G9HU90_9LAMI|nr:putative alpha/beta hydrolase [Handroanthus impetiginosus]